MRPRRISRTLLVVFLLCLCRGAAAQTPQTPAAPQPAPRPSPDPRLPSLFVVGDSTARNSANGALGWGDPFAAHFDPTKINVVNRARAGRSSRTFMTEGLWDDALEAMKAGDFVLIQFGHNDGGPVDTGRARGSLPGTGEETREMPRPDGRKEVVYTYGHYLRQFIEDARAKGVTPVVLSLTVRNIWKDGRVERGSGRFREWAAEVARSQNVEFIDLTNVIADRYEALGQEKVKALFAGDHTHTSPAGAELNAALVAEALKALKGNPLGKYFAGGAGVKKSGAGRRE